MIFLFALLMGLTAEASDEAKLGIYGGYTAYGLSNPGVHLGVEKPLITASGFTVFVAPETVFYAESGVQTGVFLQARYGTRYTLPVGLLFETAVHAGYEHYFYTETTFAYEDGVSELEEQRRNRPAFATGVGIGVGFDLSEKTSLPLAVYGRPVLSWRIPDRNLFFQNRVGVHVGATWLL